MVSAHLEPRHCNLPKWPGNNHSFTPSGLLQERHQGKGVQTLHQQWSTHLLCYGTTSPFNQHLKFQQSASTDSWPWWPSLTDAAMTTLGQQPFLHTGSVPVPPRAMWGLAMLPRSLKLRWSLFAPRIWKPLLHWHFSVEVDSEGVAKFVSKANTSLTLQVLAMLDSRYPAGKKFLCCISSSKIGFLRRLAFF